MSIKNISKTIFKFIGGNAFAQVIVIACTPLLTRIYSTTDFGVYSSVLSIILIIGVVACGRYDQLMYSFKDKERWGACFNNGYNLSIYVSLVLLLITVIVYNRFDIDCSYFVIAPGVFTFSIIQLYISYLSLHLKYREIIIGNLIRAISSVFFQFLLLRYEALGLTLGFLFSQFLVVLYFYRKTDGVNLRFCFNIIPLIGRNVCLSSGQSLANSFSSQLPVLVIPGLYGFNIMGLYGLAIRLTQLPITFFTNAVRPYILGEFNKKINDCHSVYKILWLSSVFLLFIGFLGIFFIHLFAESFFAIYAGDEWKDAGNISSILSWWLLIAFANVTATSYLTTIAKFKALFIYDITLLVFRLFIVFYVTYTHLSFLSFLYLYSFLGMLFNLFIIIYAIVCGYRNEKISNCNC